MRVCQNPKTLVTPNGIAHVIWHVLEHDALNLMLWVSRYVASSSSTSCSITRHMTSANSPGERSMRSATVATTVCIQEG